MASATVPATLFDSAVSEIRGVLIGQQEAEDRARAAVDAAHAAIAEPARNDAGAGS